MDYNQIQGGVETNEVLVLGKLWHGGSNGPMQNENLACSLPLSVYINLQFHCETTKLMVNAQSQYFYIITQVQKVMKDIFVMQF